jgi:eukaryotic-like serine/threonine-protein kinase
MQIGSYQVLFELGRGGMGAVYLARTVGPGGAERLVAIKRARQAAPTSVGSGDRFLDELRITAQLHHANVVGMHQAGSDEQGYYLVFDYVEGESLAGLVARARERGERVPVRVVLRVVLDALAGLHAAHEAMDTAGRPLGILHRDVSTHNLLVGRDGVTRLADFGIAKSTVSTAVTEQGHVEGKLAYMAPEYVQKLPVDRTVDVYAVGVTLWTALVGHEPWEDWNRAQALRALLMQGVPAPSSLGTEIAPELEAIVMRACSRDAGFRFQTARQMLDELAAVGRKLDLTATHIEVAEYIDAVVGKELATRRIAIEASRAAIEGSRGATEASRGAIETSRDVRAPTLTAPAVESDGASAVLARSWEQPLPWRGAVYAVVGLVLLAIGFAVFSRSRAPDAATEPPIASSAAIAPARASEDPVASPVVEPPPAASSAPAASAVTTSQAPRPSRTQQRSPPKASASASPSPPRGKLDQINRENPYMK